MATNPLSADVRPAKITRTPADVNAPTTRRALIAAAMTLPAVAIAGPALAQSGEHLVDRSEWERLLAAYRRAYADYAPLAKEHSRREEKMFEALAAMRPAPSEPQTPSFDKTWSLAAILAQTSTPEHTAAWERYEQARKAWTDERAAVTASVMDGAGARFEAALNRRYETIVPIRDYPVTSLDMLSTKAELLMQEFDGSLEAPEIGALVADIRRLADREG